MDETRADGICAQKKKGPLRYHLSLTLKLSFVKRRLKVCSEKRLFICEGMHRTSEYTKRVNVSAKAILFFSNRYNQIFFRGITVQLVTNFTKNIGNMVILYYFLVTIFALFTFLCENNRKKMLECESIVNFISILTR